MTEQNKPRTETLVQLSSEEMQEVMGGAAFDAFLRIDDVDGETTSRLGSANGGVWKTTNGGF